MRKVRDVLRIVEGCRCRRTLVGTFPVTGLTGENTWMLVDRVAMNTSKKTSAPFSIHNRRKSAREHCSFLVAIDRVT